MAASHRALMVWVCLLSQLTLLIAYLDKGATWDAFILLIPMWCLDSLLFISYGIKLVRHYRPNDSVTTTPYALFAAVGLVCLKVIAQVMLCVKLNGYIKDLKLVYALIPGWILLTLLIVILSRRVIDVHRMKPTRVAVD